MMTMIFVWMTEYSVGRLRTAPTFNGRVKLQARVKDADRSYSERRQGGSVTQDQDPLMTEEKG